MEVKGKVFKVLEVQSGVSKSGNEWKKGGFIVETEGQYPKKIMLTTWGAQVEQAEKLQEGQEVVASIDIESREWNDKWFTDVKAWKIDTSQAAPSQAPQNEDPFVDDQPSYDTGASLTDNSTSDPDDVPF